MTGRRPVDVPVHEWQHRLIAERHAAWTALPHRRAGDRLRRDQAGKRAWWTLTGHMRGCHGVKGSSPFLAKTWADVAAQHDRLHDAALPEEYAR